MNGLPAGLAQLAATVNARLGGWECFRLQL